MFVTVEILVHVNSDWLSTWECETIDDLQHDSKSLRLSTPGRYGEPTRPDGKDTICYFKKQHNPLETVSTTGPSTLLRETLKHDNPDEPIYRDVPERAEDVTWLGPIRKNIFEPKAH